jgi:hypothetical protein
MVLAISRSGSARSRRRAHAAGKILQIGEPPVASQYASQQDVGVEISRGPPSQYGKHDGLHILRLVDQKHWSKKQSGHNPRVA